MEMEQKQTQRNTHGISYNPQGMNLLRKCLEQEIMEPQLNIGRLLLF